MRRLPRIDDPEGGDFVASRLEFIQRMGGAGSIPYNVKEKKSPHDAEWDEDYLIRFRGET